MYIGKRGVCNKRYLGLPEAQSGRMYIGKRGVCNKRYLGLTKVQAPCTGSPKENPKEAYSVTQAKSTREGDRLAAAANRIAPTLRFLLIGTRRSTLDTLVVGCVLYIAFWLLDCLRVVLQLVRHFGVIFHVVFTAMLTCIPFGTCVAFGSA
ncbi:unnamed protein product [Lathyrus oleraceus]